MKILRLPAVSSAEPAAADGLSFPHILVDAPAKVNLTLEILGKRPDGYHELCSLMMAIDLCDQLQISAHECDLILTCDQPELSVGPENLILKAARKLQEATGCTRGARIELRKRIPWAAGLGGGSSDAAAALAGLNEWWDLKLPVAELARLGAELGSDVPFFFYGPLAMCRGRGEIIEPIPLEEDLHLVLVAPRLGLSTVEVYRALNCQKPVADAAANLRESELLEAVQTGDAERLAGFLKNDLQEPAMRLSPLVEQWYRRLQNTTASGCLMSGSGSSLFALCRNARDAEQIAQDLQKDHPERPDSARIWTVKTDR